MIQTKNLVLSAALGMFLFAGTARAQDSRPDETKERAKPAADKDIDADTLIAKLMKKYAGFKDFSCTIDKATKMGFMNIKSDIDVKWKGKAKFRTHSTQMVPMMGEMVQRVYKDGEKLTIYRSKPAKEYAEVGGDSQQAYSDAPVLLALLQGKKGLLGGFGAPKAKEVTVDGKTYERLIFSPAPQMQIAYDFDKTTGLIAGSKAKIAMTPPGGGGMQDPNGRPMKLNIEIVETYNDVKTDAGIDDSEFVFKAPEGAKKVDNLRMPGMGMPGMGGGPRRAPGSRPVEPKKPADKDDDKDDDGEDF